MLCLIFHCTHLFKVCPQHRGIQKYPSNFAMVHACSYWLATVFWFDGSGGSFFWMDFYQLNRSSCYRSSVEGCSRCTFRSFVRIRRYRSYFGRSWRCTNYYKCRCWGSIFRERGYLRWWGWLETRGCGWLRVWRIERWVGRKCFSWMDWLTYHSWKIYSIRNDVNIKFNKDE